MTGETVKVEVSFPKTRIAELTTDNPASSFGQPVLVIDGQTFGPADYPEFVLSVSDHGPVIPEAAILYGQAVREEPRIVCLWNKAVWYLMSPGRHASTVKSEPVRERER